MIIQRKGYTIEPLLPLGPEKKIVKVYQYKRKAFMVFSDKKHTEIMDVLEVRR